MHKLAASALLGSLALAGSAAAAPAPGGVVVELFTSQGCSSCPPADAVLARLAAEPGVVAISRPVTYWDNLGWKDTLARPENTALQNAYAQRLGGGRYTPEIVVGGRAGAIGSREGEVRALIARTRPAAALTVARGPDGARVTIAGTGKATLRLVALASRVTVNVGNGENSGRRITYYNVVKTERPIGWWTGGAKTVTVPASALMARGADRFAVIAQQGESGPVLAGAYL